MRSLFHRAPWSGLLLLTAGLPAITSAQGSPSAPHPITMADIAAWKSIRGGMLSHDGQWFAYTVAPNEGDAEAIVRQTTAGGTVHRFPIGEAPAAAGGPGAGGPGGGSSGLLLSGDGKWAAMLVYPKAAEQKRLRQQRRPVHASALVVNLTTGTQRTFERVRRMALSGDQPGWIALQLAGPDAPAGGAGGGGGGGPAPGAPGMGGNPLGGGSARVEGTDLLLVELGGTAVYNIGNVADFAFDDTGAWLAYVIDAREMAGNGVQLRELRSGAMQVVDGGKALYRRLAWSDTAHALAFLKGTADSAGTDTTWSAIGMAGVGSAAPRRATVGTGAPMPTGMEISPDRAPRWTETLDGLVVGVRVASAPVPKSELIEDDEKPTLILWHHKDPRLQSMQLVQEQADRGFSFLAVYRPATNTLVQLTDATVRTGTLGGRDALLLGSDNSAYERQSNLDGIQRRDLYVVNSRTGEKALVKREARANAQLSPDGRMVVYWDDGHWQAYDVATRVTTAITKGAPVSFVDTEDDHNVDRPPTQFLGFSRDSRYVLLQDNYDIWRVALPGSGAAAAAGGKAAPFLNLTGNGRSERIRYSRRIVTDPREKGVDLTQPMYVVAMQHRTKKEAVVRLDPGKAGAVVVSGWRDARMTPMKAKDAEVWVSSIQTSARFPIGGA